MGLDEGWREECVLFFFATIVQRIAKRFQCWVRGSGDSGRTPRAQMEEAASWLDYASPRHWNTPEQRGERCFQHSMWTAREDLQRASGHAPFSCSPLSNQCRPQSIHATSLLLETDSTVCSRPFGLGSLLLIRKYVHICNTKWYLLLTPLSKLIGLRLELRQGAIK